jgi:hypothetical protein
MENVPMWVVVLVTAIIFLIAGMYAKKGQAAGCLSKNKCCDDTVEKIFNRLKGEAALPESYKKYEDLCFHGNSLVEMSNGSFKKIKDIRKGDVVKTESGNSKVQCLVISQSENNTTSFVNVNGLLVTPWHPVKINNVWKFPSDMGETIKMNNQFVYNLVLESGHVININGVKAVTLGHDLQGDVVGHEYFGSKKVVEDMKKMSGWKQGLLFLYGVRLNNDLINGVSQRA